MDNLEFYDLYDIWYEPSWLTKYWVHLLIISLMSILFSIAIIWYMRLRKKNYSYQIIKALQDLQKTVDNDPQITYCKLIIIMKTYMAKRFALPCLGQTDLEFKTFCNQWYLAQDIKEEIHELLHESDVIKFTPVSIKSVRVKQLIDNSIRFVKKTYTEQKAYQ